MGETDMSRREAIRVMSGFILTVMLMAGAIALLAVITRGRPDELETDGEPVRTVVIDAGHGGMDGGAVAPDGTPEKEINLEIARILCSLMRVSGYKVVMTRETDTMLGQDIASGSAKMRDLKKRLEVSSSYPEALTVSIHCNKFPSESCRGLQVYFSDSEEARQTAEAIQTASTLLDPQNKRKIKKADSSIYLLKRAVAPSVLVECGFLSNGEELKLLKDGAYRKKLALVLMTGAESFYGY